MYLSDLPGADMCLTPEHPCNGCPVRDRAVCNALSQRELATFRRSGGDTLLAPGEALCWEGDAASQVYTITSGVLRLSKLLHDGRRQVTGFVFPGDFLGVTLEDLHPFTAEAVSDARLCRFSRARFEAFVTEHPHLERRLYAAAATELSAARDQLVLLGRKTASERLASFILQMARRTPQASDGSLRATLPMSRMDIADYLGLRIETISREFSALKGARLIRMTSTHDLLIQNRMGLESLAAVDR